MFQSVRRKRLSWVRSGTQFLQILFIESFDGKDFNIIPQSKYNHDDTRGLGSYQGKAFVTGCSNSKLGCERKTEILDLQTQTWSDGDDYPFTNR